MQHNEAKIRELEIPVYELEQRVEKLEQ